MHMNQVLNLLHLIQDITQDPLGRCEILNMILNSLTSILPEI